MFPCPYYMMRFETDLLVDRSFLRSVIIVNVLEMRVDHIFKVLYLVDLVTRIPDWERRVLLLKDTQSLLQGFDVILERFLELSEARSQFNYTFPELLLTLYQEAWFLWIHGFPRYPRLALNHWLLIRGLADNALQFIFNGVRLYASLCMSCRLMLGQIKFWAIETCPWIVDSNNLSLVVLTHSGSRLLGWVDWIRWGDNLMLAPTVVFLNLTWNVLRRPSSYWVLLFKSYLCFHI